MPKGVDYLQNKSFEERQKRDLRHRHNSFQGHVAMARGGMLAIMSSKTATQMAKHQAAVINQALKILGDLLKARV